MGKKKRTVTVKKPKTPKKKAVSKTGKEQKGWKGTGRKKIKATPKKKP